VVADFMFVDFTGKDFPMRIFAESRAMGGLERSSRTHLDYPALAYAEPLRCDMG